MHLELSEIPPKHLMKRWTREARDILPEKLLMYQKDQGQPKSVTYRHSKLYIKALEIVQLGDSNVKCYEVAMTMLNDVASTLAPISVERDGMGLADREAAAN